jgi:hypothetical protein
MPAQDFIANAGSALLNNPDRLPQSNALETALKMIMGGGQSNIPLTTQQTAMPQVLPQVRHTPAEIQTAQGEFATSSGNRRVAMNNMFGNVANMVNKYGQEREAKQERNLTMDMQRLFEAQEGLQQAQANKDDKMAEHNQAIIESIMGDPKKARAIEKAFNINLLGDDKGKDSVERKALLKAYSQWKQGGSKGQNPLTDPNKQGGSVMDRFKAAMPQIQGLNPSLVAQAQLGEMQKKAGMVTDVDKLKAITDLQIQQAKGDQTKEVAILNNNGRALASKIAADAARFGHMMSYYGRLDAETQRGLNELSKIQTKFEKDLTKPENLKDLQTTTQTSLKNMKDSLKASQTSLEKLPYFGQGEAKARVQKDIQFKQEQIRRLESVQQYIQGMVERGRGISNPSSDTDPGKSGTGSSTNPQASSGETVKNTGVATTEQRYSPEVVDQLFNAIISGWTGRAERDPYQGRETK